MHALSNHVGFYARDAINDHGLLPLGNRDDNKFVAGPQRVWLDFAGVEDGKGRCGLAGFCRSIGRMLHQGKFMGKDERTTVGFFYFDNPSGNLDNPAIEDVRFGL